MSEFWESTGKYIARRNSHLVDRSPSILGFRSGCSRSIAVTKAAANAGFHYTHETNSFSS